MENFEIKLIPSTNLMLILPLLKELNTFTSEDILLSRINDMKLHENYKCLGIFLNKELIGVCGLWHLTRHYCGKTVEPDHVIITEKHRNKGFGSLLFEWIDRYSIENGFECIELNTYISNVKSHQFYENEGFIKLGFHFIKYL